MPLTERHLTKLQRERPLGADLMDAVLRVEGMFDPTRIGLFGRALRMEVRAGVTTMDNVFGDEWHALDDDPNVHYRVRYLAQVWLWAPAPTCDALKRFRPDDGTIIFDNLAAADCARLQGNQRKAMPTHLPRVADGPLALPVFAAPYAGGRLSLADLRAAQAERISAIRQRLLLKTRLLPASSQSRTPPLRKGAVPP